MWYWNLRVLKYYTIVVFQHRVALTFTLLTWRIWRAPNNAKQWQMGINSAFKGLIYGDFNMRVL